MQYLNAKNQVMQDAQLEASDIASLIANRLHTQFNWLQFAAIALLGPDADPIRPDPNVVRTLRQFMALNPSLYAFNIQSADGNTILWSTNAQSVQPITSGAQFTPQASNPDFLLGQDRYSARVGTHVISMRYRVRASDGSTRFFVGTPYRMDQLLQPINPARFHPWDVTIIDTRDDSILGALRQGRLTFPSGKVSAAAAVIRAVPDVPLRVDITPAESQIQATYMRTAPTRWRVEAFTLLLLSLAGWGIVWLLSQRAKANASLRRMIAFSTLRADLLQALATTEEERILLQTLCDLAVRQGEIALAWIARPDPNGLFTVLAAAGRTAYLDGLVISSREDRPEGQGPSGRAFRENRAVFNDSFADMPKRTLWRSKAEDAGLTASGALPIVRDGEVWGILAMYRADNVAFDAPLQAVLLELAADIGQGLERVQRARELLLLRAALQSSIDGVFISDTDQRGVYINPAFTQITGYTADEVLGKNCNILQGPETDTQTVDAIRQSLQQNRPFMGEILNYRKEGTPFWNQLRITTIYSREEHKGPIGYVGVQRDVSRQRAEQSLSRALLDNAAVGILVAQARKIEAANPRMAQMLGRPTEALLGQDTRLLYPDDATFEQVGHTYVALSPTEHVTLRSIPLMRVDGRTLLCDLTGIILADGETSVWTFEDVSVRAAQARQLAILGTLARAQSNVHTAAASALSTADLCAQICAMLVDVLQSPLVWIAQWPAGSAPLASAITLLGAAGDMNPLQTALAAPDLPSTPQLRILEAAVLTVQTLQPVFGTEYNTCQVGLPIHDGTAENGILSLTMHFSSEQCGEGEIFNDEVREALRTLASTVGQALEIFRQRTGLARLQRIYQALAAEGDILLHGRNEQDMLERTCTRLVEGGLFAVLWVVRPDEHGTFITLAKAGAQAHLLEKIHLTVETEEALVSQAWRTQVTTIAQDRRAAERNQPWATHLDQSGWASSLATPVWRGGQVFAIMAFASVSVDAFDIDTRSACERVAMLLGHGLDELDLKDRLVQLQRKDAVAARTDALTCLPNRFALEQMIPKALARAQRQGTLVAVGMLDLDDFKPVNDTYGHNAGDILLRELAKALQAQLRDADFIARLGGDEFVVVLEGLDPAHALAQLEIVLHRLGEVTHSPFDLGEGRSAQVGITMGIALYPQDGEDAGTLLRYADAAMYQAKVHKTDRTQWWCLWREGTLETPQIEELFDVFGTEAQRALQDLAPALQTIAPKFGQVFYTLLQQDPDLKPLLACLTPQEFMHLQAMQAEHLQFLLNPQTTQEQIRTQAQHIGRTHALVGVSGAALLHSVGLYSDLLRDYLEQTPIRAQSRYRALRTAQARLQLDVQTELNTMQKLTDNYYTLLTHPLPHESRWIDLMPQELERLVSLPGIRAAAVFRVVEQGSLRIEAAAGTVASQMQEALDTLGIHPSIIPGPDGLRGPMGQAWVSGQNQIVDAYLQDPLLEPWHPIAQELGLRSALAIPILRGQTTVAVLIVLGAHPHQFSSSLLRTWPDALQHRWNQVMQASTGAQQPVDAVLAAQWRTAIHQGALRMVVQPVVDLHTGVVMKVEALARLQTPEGRLASPGEFLPALGEEDLQMLFRQGLEQSLASVRQWRQSGLEITLSLNLAPSTLAHPDCPLWVEHALRDADLPPAALMLEVLETQEIDPHTIDEAIMRLHSLGVGLSMDDLGSGYSSLNRLARMPFDLIKIDQDLVKNAVQNPLQGIGLMRTVLQIGWDMDCAVVAEGLEDAALIEVAMRLGCPLGQGYGLARPMPLDEFPGWVRANTPLSLPGRGELHSWLGATAYAWLWRRHAHEDTMPDSLAACPLTGFLQRQGVEDTKVLDWHAKAHESALEDERVAAHKALLQWLAEQVK